MGVTFGGIEEKVADTGAGDVLVFWGYIGEDDAGGYFLTGPAKSSGL
jgi:hypothetical protein